jgi:mannose-6-phosphate isomerase-like protein (cupin superfamily)
VAAAIAANTQRTRTIYPDHVTYPPARYFGTTGEISAISVPHDAPADIEYAHGGRCTYLATGATTNGQFGLYKWEMGTAPRGADPHFHRSISESFFILTGTVRIYDGDKWVDAVPGDFKFVPEGGIHGFKNESGEPASMLILFAPGAPREAYFEGILRLGEMSQEEKDEFFLKHDNLWL